MRKYSLRKTPKETRHELAAKHRRLRKDCGWTQAETAERADVSLGSLKRFEQTGKISLENLLRLAHLFGRLEDFDRVFYLPENLDHLFTEKA